VDGTITSQELIQYFSEEIQKRERNHRSGRVGNTPYAPVFIVYLGEAALKNHEKIQEALIQLWPQFENEIKFCGIADSGRYVLPSDEGIRTEVGNEDIEQMVSLQFGLETHFECHQYLNIYYILETTDFQTGEELYDWDTKIQEFRRMFSTIALQEFLFILLNEDLKVPHKAVAAKVRGILSGYQGNREDRTLLPSINSVYLLSNLRSDNRILETWDMCCRVVADVIVVSNSQQTHTGFAMESGVVTVGYAREDKPLRDIGQIVVHETIERLYSMTERERLTINDEVIQRLGITGRGTLRIFDEYADEIELPDPSIFPRCTNEDVDVEMMTWKEFDRLTMGSWTAYLASVTQEADSLAKDGYQVKEFTSKIRENIQSHFSLGECIDLSENTSEIRTKISPRNASGEEDVLTAARTSLKYFLSSSNTLKDVFIHVIEELGKEAEQVREVWEKLLISKSKDFAVHESSLITYYQSICDAYFTAHANGLRQSVNSVRTVEEQRKLLKDTLKGIIESNQIFGVAFDEELESRMQAVGKAVDAKNFIKSRLSGDSVHVYLQVPFALGTPRQCYVLMDTTTALRAELAKTLIDVESGYMSTGIDEKYVYFNTGNNSAAETLQFYTVESIQLMAEGEG
jgi:hypothetical protein